jgi:hypothetical protein
MAEMETLGFEVVAVGVGFPSLAVDMLEFSASA